MNNTGWRRGRGGSVAGTAARGSFISNLLLPSRLRCRPGYAAVRCLILLTFLSGVAFASGEPDAFALNGVGARPAGMGGAAAGLADDIESIYYNPAGLGNLIQSGVTAMYQTPSLDTSRSFLAFNKRWAHPKAPGSLAFGWLRLRSGDIELTNDDEQILGTDSLTNDLFMIGAGVRPWPHWSVGGMMKFMRFAFNGFSESGFGGDLGVHAQYNPLRFGVSLSDIGGTYLSGSSISAGSPDASDKVPPRLRTGVGLTLPEPFSLPVRLALDIDALFRLEGAQDARFFYGAEVWGFQDRAGFRTGLQQGVGPTFGFSARFGLFQIDYAYLLSNNLRDEHRLGTTVRL